ncbi:MAG: hypothetical protein ACXWZW_00960 [Solirubrobacterales bacterium]
MVAGRGGARRTVAIALALAAAAVTAPSGASAAPGEVYASDFDQHAVWKLPAAGGNSAVKITATGIGETAGMAIGPDGRIYVGAQTGRVWRIDTATASIALFAELGAGRIAEDVAFDAQGRLLVLDRGQNDVLAVDRVTKAVTPVFDGPGTTDFGSLAAMRNGDLFITTQSGDDLLRLSGGVLTPVIENTIDFPDALTLWPTSATCSSFPATTTVSTAATSSPASWPKSIRASSRAGWRCCRPAVSWSRPRP